MEITVAIAAEGVLACLLPDDFRLVVAAEQYRMNMPLKDLRRAKRIALFVFEHPSLRALADMFLEKLRRNAMQFDDALGVGCGAITIVRHVLDTQAEQFADSKIAGSQHGQQNTVLTFRTFHDLTHLLVGESRTLLFLWRPAPTSSYL